jgi:hypothetical protein
MGIRGEVYNGSFLCFKSRFTFPFLVKCFINDRFNTFPVTLRSQSDHPRGKVIYKSDRSSLPIDLSLYEICVKEE